MGTERIFVARLALTLALTCLVSCHPPLSDVGFDEQVRAWIPAGATADEAEAVMRGQNFEVFRQESESGSYLDCTREQRLVRDGPETLWRVRLFIEDDVVSTIQSSID